ncbi:MAG: DUF1343 domain-containing protein [Pseudomonadota bacterium]
MNRVETGLERLIGSPPDWMAKKRIGLLCNPASVDRWFNHSRKLIAEAFPGQVIQLYSPQHGFFSEKQDNMLESEDMLDPLLQIPVYSLYGKTRVPDKNTMDRIDLLIVDLQDAGCRVYTFIYTMSYCMEVARELGKKVLVLDRPNPIGGVSVEGNCLNPAFSSFVGRYPIPMRHGLTIGEIALLFNHHFSIGCDLSVLPMKGWKRRMYFADTGLPWVLPSPNLPSPISAMVYPGQVIWEGTNASEGRGTALPFEVFGAPYIDPDEILSALGGNSFSGMVLRPLAFEPTSNKWKGVCCRGFQIHVTDPDLFSPYEASLKIMQAVMLNCGDRFEWKNPPYEYEFEKLPIDLILGDPQIRQSIEKAEPIEDIAESWRKDTEDFRRISRSIYLYS